jgi:endonuclease/exonuclease/phosphatase family metal-dependent hydrolase
MQADMHSERRRRGISFLVGAIACVALMSLAACNRKQGTPEWSHDESAPVQAQVDREIEAATDPADAPPSSAAPTVQPPPPVPAEAQSNTSQSSSDSASAPTATPSAPRGRLRFIAYNVENWLTMDRWIDGREQPGLPKPDAEKDAVIRMLVRHQPDVLGLCEIGQREDLDDIRIRLKDAGIDLPHAHHVGGSDTTRFLGLLSRYPITSTAQAAETSFEIRGKPFAINRGILDATVEADGKPYRFLGVHLKSKREVPETSQELMRQNEARLLRRHLDAVLDADPAARLIVYGDINDTRSSRSFKSIVGKLGAPGHLVILPLADSRGHLWTHHWSSQDVYSRIDYITITPNLQAEVIASQSRILDDPEWHEASDHRALLTVFE